MSKLKSVFLIKIQSVAKTFFTVYNTRSICKVFLEIIFFLFLGFAARFLYLLLTA